MRSSRYELFVQAVVRGEVAWRLWKGRWAVTHDDASGELVFPLWPAHAAADASCVGDWAGYRAEPIALSDLVNDLLPKLAVKQVVSGVFPAPGEPPITISASELEAALRAAMAEQARQGQVAAEPTTGRNHA